MTIEEARGLMLTPDEICKIYERIYDSGEEQTIYMINGSHEVADEILIDQDGTWMYDPVLEEHVRVADVESDLLKEYGKEMYARAGTGCYRLSYMGWACFRSKADADAWEAATLGRNDET
jgi:hypothetical protein